MEGAIADVTTALMSLDALVIYAIGFAVLLACGLGLPVPEDITLLLMGYMTYLPLPDGGARPHADPALAVVIGLAGVMIGDATMFMLGRKLGMRLIDRWPFRVILGGGRLAKATQFLHDHGPRVLFAARFMPGLRSVVFFTSGTLGISLARFVVYDGLAALLSVPALVLSSWYWGAQFDAVRAWANVGTTGMTTLIVATVAIWLLVKVLRQRRQQARAAGS